MWCYFISNFVSDNDLGHTLSLEYINLCIALMVYSIRYSAIFWSTNKCLGIMFSIQLLINGVHILLSYCGMTILYKVRHVFVIPSVFFVKIPNYTYSKLVRHAEIHSIFFYLCTLLFYSSSFLVKNNCPIKL